MTELLTFKLFTVCQYYYAKKFDCRMNPLSVQRLLALLLASPALKKQVAKPVAAAQKEGSSHSQNFLHSNTSIP